MSAQEVHLIPLESLRAAGCSQAKALAIKDLAAKAVSGMVPTIAQMHALSDQELVEKLGQWSPIPATYAGGAKTLADLEETTRLGRGKVDLTIGSALDIFGGSGVKYADAVAFNWRARAQLPG